MGLGGTKRIGVMGWLDRLQCRMGLHQTESTIRNIEIPSKLVPGVTIISEYYSSLDCKCCGKVLYRFDGLWSEERNDFYDRYTGKWDSEDL